MKRNQPLGFLTGVFIIYLCLYGISPDKTMLALRNSCALLYQITIPLCIVFFFMVLMDYFLRSNKIVKILGKKSGFKGFLLAAMAGVFSVGTIFAWYPLLEDLKKRGASNATLATFLCNRSVKPFLIPVMISYFGWLYVVLLTLFTVLGAVAVGIGVGAFAENH